MAHVLASTSRQVKAPAQSTPTEITPEIRARARHLIYERLALLSAITWVVGTFLIFTNIVAPTTDRPTVQIAISMLAPIVPAAVPWLFYGLISDVVARRWS